ncbi:SacI homology domain-containing protein [Glomus cerebriforme]|uniref:SacI homology domain-containing protein n=1 Tax=Glomus cerebriforme TaxID=658196 RepID=A0A397SZB9_9GLOM|nr:SacI homology domain-containing protein [Glomus cerebriforme]
MFLLKKRTSIPPTPIVPPTPVIPPPLHKRINLVIDKKVFILIAGNDFLEIESETGKIVKKDAYEPSQDAKFYDIFGVVGFLELLSGRYIIVITDRKNLGQVQGKNVYIIKSVAILPLDYDRALKILEKHPWPIDGDVQEEDIDILNEDANNLEGEGRSHQRHQRYITNEIMETDVEEATKDFPPTVSVTPPPSASQTSPELLSFINKKQPVTALLSKMKSAFSDLNKKRSPSFSSNGSDSDYEDREGEFRSVSTSLNENVVTDSGDLIINNSDVSSPSDKLSPLSTAAKRVSEVWDGFTSDYANPKPINIKDPIDKKVMDVRISKEIALLFRSDAFFFSYELDITTSLQQKYAKGFPKKELPLWKQANERFWWNEHMLKGFIELELHAWILPIMQGYVQCEPCQIDEQEFDFILISRRSRERAGLRYQRRGINEDGAVANFVETEQILSTEIEGTNHDVSFLQIRGSIPLFWSQSPYGLKPKPVLERSTNENALAFKKHFDKLIKMYGHISCINLAELTNREAIVGEAYREAVERLGDEKNIEYIEFDFHKQCKGMKYENILKLVEMVKRNFNKMGYFWQAGKITSEKEVHCQQAGIFRTNCMDCLDRTNVVQSALAREVLNLQMLRLGILEFIDGGISHYEQFENIFNDVWANNGDSISREYAGTSALKGDFTRTGKRNFQGVVNDASNSLARMFQNTFKDFFRQATIDYILGNHSIEVFQELQQKFEASQPGDSERWAKVRATAIEISSSIVIIDNEEKINGWTFLSPTEPNTLRGKSYEEKVLLLTKKALYVCTFHYRLEKVMQFKRIGLGEITSIEKGEYILSTLYPSCVSIEDNYGFIVYYRASGESSRINSGSMRNNNNYKANDNDSNNNSEAKKLMAFKAFRSNLVGEATKFDGGSGGVVSGEKGKTSQQMVNEVVEEIVKACWDIGNAEDVGFVIERPIISLEEANKNTGIMTKVGFKVKQALWL